MITSQSLKDHLREELERFMSVCFRFDSLGYVLNMTSQMILPGTGPY
jgi:hypothetical protein